MKCRVCGQEAVVKLPSHHTAFCVEHFDAFFQRRVEYTIKHFKMFHRDESILVAVSGGKDSQTLLKVLQVLDYKVQGLHINLGIEQNSDNALKIVRKFSISQNIEIHIVNIIDFINGTIPQIAKKVRKPACSVCGMIKRYILNRVALSMGFSTIATGHNLDDETARLLGNLFHWNMQYLGSQYPVLDEQDGFAKKVKPLVLCAEKETLTYAIVNKIQFDKEKCPLSKGASSQFYKHILHRVEMEMPGTKIMFLKLFFDNVKKQFETDQANPLINNCTECGYPTLSNGICSFCRLKNRLTKA